MDRIELTGKQKRDLRSMGQTVKVSCIIGKGGMTGAIVEDLSKQLQKHELVKVKMPAGTAKEREAMAASLADSAAAACVSILGRTALLYRPEQ